MDKILIAEGISVTYPNNNGGLQALADVSFDVAPGEFVCLVGPSGCGKSTLLRALGGLQRPNAGRVIFEGEPLTAPRRRIGFVFQKATLLPWRTVLDNVLLPLQLAGADPAEARERALGLIELVGLRGFEASRPRDLSGGMEQRVAIARALIHEPDMLLLDEPFGALDALTRERMGSELLRIWEARRKPVVMVTHSIQEAIFLADRVLVMSQRPGRVQAALPVPLPRPRKQAMVYEETFGALAAKVRGALDLYSE
jgi:NitT/TauT family transport system ATP-binding protein